MEIPFEIISTGSKGNAVIINNSILIDCGVPFSKIEAHAHDFKLVLLTHIHGDHFKKSTLKKLAFERPSIRFVCGEWLVKPLVDLGIRASRIDVLPDRKKAKYSICEVESVPLSHDVPNCGYKIKLPNGSRLIYCTDTGNLNGVSAKNFDLYLIEANYATEDLKARMDAKKAEGLFSYEKRVVQTHLSLEQAMDFVYSNIGDMGEYVLMHEHEVTEAEEKLIEKYKGDNFEL